MWLATSFCLAVFLCSLVDTECSPLPTNSEEVNSDVSKVMQVDGDGIGAENIETKSVNFVPSNIRDKRNFDYSDYYFGSSSEEGFGERSKRQNFFDDTQDPDFESEFPSRPLFVSKGNVISQPAPLASTDDDANSSSESKPSENESPTTEATSPTTEATSPTRNASVEFEVIPAVAHHEEHYQFDNNRRNPEGEGFHFRKNLFWFNNFGRPRPSFNYDYRQQPFHHYHPGLHDYRFYFFYDPYGGYPRFPSRFKNTEQNYQQNEHKHDVLGTTTEAIPNFSLDVDVRLNF